MTTLSVPRVASLVWDGDELVDWAGGGRRIRLDGSVEPSPVHYAYRFDAALQGPDGFSCVYTRLGTKALLLRHGRIVRELDRSFYQAHRYEYPIALVAGPEGRTLVVHCPEGYNRLDIDDALTGERLTASPERKPADFFHSRLAASPSGTGLLSAGWVWHPWDVVAFYSLEEALRDPRHLDGARQMPRSSHLGIAEASSATWLTDERVVIGSSNEEEDAEEVAELHNELRLRTVRLRTRGLAVFSVSEQRCLSSTRLGRPPGTMMAVGDRHVVTFYEHPRLVALDTGAVEREWPELPSGGRVGSIATNAPEEPPLALDPAHRRFAIAIEDRVVVVQVA